MTSYFEKTTKIYLMLRKVKEERNASQTIKRQKANWIGHIFSRNCLLRKERERRVEVTG
jgi:hypothetical protein